MRYPIQISLSWTDGVGQTSAAQRTAGPADSHDSLVRLYVEWTDLSGAKNKPERRVFFDLEEEGSKHARKTLF